VLGVSAISHGYSPILICHDIGTVIARVGTRGVKLDVERRCDDRTLMRPKAMPRRRVDGSASEIVDRPQPELTIRRGTRTVAPLAPTGWVNEVETDLRVIDADGHTLESRNNRRVRRHKALAMSSSDCEAGRVGRVG
jgi:hypothetical protein